ncbi:MAG: hypothetical protein MEQ07_11525 [Aquimonas sp.]|nr:hypothetical protein [Aquimonas sp.]
MPLELPQPYDADSVERAVPAPAQARALLQRELPGLSTRLSERHQRWGGEAQSPERIRAIEDAVLLGLARLGVRHGRWGQDFHAYHNEAHVMDLLIMRIDRLHAHPAAASLELEDWLRLELFASCHDLRQREGGGGAGPLGANEAASIAETRRILGVCGLAAELEPELHLALDLMIAGSTFDARPAPARAVEETDRLGPNSAELAAGGGALAPRLVPWLREAQPDLLNQAGARKGLRLARIAADLDTANVGEVFGRLCDSAVQLCEEREMRAGRRLGSARSAAPCREFLLQAQLRYIEDLHRFASEEGEATFGSDKALNLLRMRGLTGRLQTDGAFRQAQTGSEVIEAFFDASLQIDGTG